MNTPPVDIGDLAKIKDLIVGQTYILTEVSERGNIQYQYVVITGKGKINLHRYALDMDILNNNKTKIGRRSFRIEDTQTNQLFYKLKTVKLAEAIGKQATRQAIDEVYEAKTGQSASPGTGPADLIRGFVGVQPPKTAKGRKTRRRHIQRSLRRNRSRRNR
jgi:hypothetical protein